jgi:uncharacterized protein YcaQ
MPMLTLSQAAVRGLMIAAQGLDDTPRPPATKADVLSIIRKIHMLQIDSISAVARAPYFVLWSRLGDYNPDWLDELLNEVALFEHYAHAVCLLPIEDYPLYMVGTRIFDWRNPHKWLDEHADVAERVLNHIYDNGGARASDFQSMDGIKHTWENPKEEQTALDYLLFTGKLMVRERRNYQRVYDLRERIFPEADKLPAVSVDEAHDQLVLYAIQAYGVAKVEWIASYHRLKSAWVNAALKRLTKKDRLMTVAVEGWEKPGYIHPDNLKQVEAAAEGNIPHSKTSLLSPFDQVVWDRGRALDLFGFDFPIEFYFPAAKRKYGYFSLPILYDNKLIGRLDPKAQRKEGIFEIKSIHLEPGVVVDDALVEAVKSVIKACAEWHQTPQVIIRDTTESGLADIFRVD